jgi:hypothetical protein
VVAKLQRMLFQELKKKSALIKLQQLLLNQFKEKADSLFLLQDF